MTLPASSPNTLPLMDPGKFEHMERLATMMATCSLLPDHLRNGADKKPLAPQQVIANAFMVVNQAIRWNMDPFALAGESYVIGGKLAFQGKVAIALINTQSGIIQPVEFAYSGNGDGRTVTVSGSFPGDAQPRTITLSVGQAKTNNQMWTKDPDQKLAYSGAIKWARRHCPQVVMGVLTLEDVEQMGTNQPATKSVSGSVAPSMAAALIEALPPVEEPQTGMSAASEYREAMAATSAIEDLQAMYVSIGKDERLTEKEKTDLRVECKAKADAIKAAK